VVCEHVFTGIPVANRGAAMDWYERLFARPPDLIPNDDEAAWQLTPTSWIYIVADFDRAGSGLNTLLVDDLDRFVAGLGERGIAPGPIELIADGSVRQAIVVDGDGNRLKVGQVLKDAPSAESATPPD